MTSAERREIRYQRRKAKREEARKKRSMACGDFEEVFSFRHLYLSGKKCCKGVYWKSSTQRYIGNIIPNIALTARSLNEGNFYHRGFHEFTIMERGKKRYIRSVHITERAVQKCLCDYCIVPIYSSSFIYDNSASLKHRGMDFALRRMICHLQKHYRKHGLAGGILIFDFKSYFDEAPHGPLTAEAKRRLHDDRVRSLHDSFIADFGPVGLGLGSQISQTNALLLPSPIVHYFKEKPAAGAYEISRTVEVIPERRTELIDIEIKVTNITSAAGAPCSHLTAMCEGVDMETASKYGNSVTHEFVLNNKRVDPDNYKVGTISKKLVSFGPEQENDACVNRHQLVMHFVLVNGETHTVTLDVRDLIKTSHDETQRVHKIRAEITLPEAIGNGDGVFDPDIEEWEEIETELTI